VREEDHRRESMNHEGPADAGPSKRWLKPVRQEHLALPVPVPVAAVGGVGFGT
jgi:hypothetical protein